MAILQDSERDLCVDNPFASAGPSETRVDLTEDQKAQVAKVLYERGQRAQAEGDLECALELFEEAYYQIPGKHRFALRVGELAVLVGDCVKAWDYLEHYLAYADYDKYDDRERAKALLDTPEMRSCARPPKVVPSPDSHPMVCLEMPFPDPEPPASPPESKRQRRDRERAERKAEREQERASKMFRRK
jgi:tetratricopeptide (TPR) repeat protein